MKLQRSLVFENGSIVIGDHVTLWTKGGAQIVGKVTELFGDGLKIAELSFRSADIKRIAVKTDKGSWDLLEDG